MNEQCIICQIVVGSEKSWKVYEDESVLAFLDINPVNEFHTLVVPKKHCVNVFDATEQQLTDVMSAIRKIVHLFQEKLGVENVQIINSSGAHAQQDVDHLHFHVIPRYEGDGQDIELTFQPELKRNFDALIERVKQ